MGWAGAGTLGECVTEGMHMYVSSLAELAWLISELKRCLVIMANLLSENDGVSIMQYIPSAKPTNQHLMLHFARFDH